jgi:hypothetical protein
LLLLGKADFFLLPCPFKYLFGIDCPGCGFQRSVLALLRGDFSLSFKLYPPTVPLLICFISAACTWLLKLNQNALALKVMYFVTGFFIFFNYLYKMLFQHIH